MSKESHLDLLGKTGRDRITGFKGTITSISFDLFGCIQLVLKPDVGEDGKMIDGCWFDIARVQILSDVERKMPVPQFAPLKGPEIKPAGML